MDGTATVADYLGLDSRKLSDSDTEVIKTIHDFAKGDSTDSSEVITKVRGLEIKLGTPGLGERRIDKIYRYIKLNSLV